MSVRACLITIALGAALVTGSRRAEPVRAPVRQGPALVARPLVFEANRGQTDESVRFLARGAGGTAFLTDTEAVLAARTGALRIRPVTDARLTAEGIDELPGKANYFIGNDPSRWRTNVPTFARVRCAGVWPGIDLVYHASDAGRLEYDFVVAPGADPSVIAVEFAGEDHVTIDARGDVVVHVGATEFRQEAPVVYEETDGARRRVEGRYVMDGADRVRFEVAGRDESRTLFIDPVVYATYLGGNDPSGGLERIAGMAKDSQGNTYVSGGTTSADFPLSGPFQSTYKGAGGFTRGDVFVTKIDPTGHTILYSTYLGGAADDEASGIAVDALGSAFTTGVAYSSDFPTTPGSVQPSHHGNADGFVTKLSLSGDALAYSTYIGGGSNDGMAGIAVGGLGQAYVCGGSSGGIPTTAGAFQVGYGGGPEDVVVLELTPAGDALVYATYLGGSDFERGSGLVVNASGDAFVTGYTASGNFPVFPAAQPGAKDRSQVDPKALPGGVSYQPQFAGGPFDGFVARLDATGAVLVFSTYLGGSGEDAPGPPSFDGLGNLCVPGYTTSTDFPTLLPIQPANGGGRDAFVAKFAANGSAMYSTYFGGTGNEIAYAAAGAAGAAWLTGYTESTDFPTVNAPKTTLGGSADAFLAKVNAAGTAFDEVTYVGGSGNDYGYAIVLDAAGDPLLGGQTSSTDLATPQGAFQPAFGGGSNDAFLSSFPGAVAITSFFLPKKVTAKVDAADASKSTLVAGGIFDTGPDAPDFASAATLDVGGLHFDIAGLTPAGKGFAFTGSGVTLSIAPNPYGSSRAKFKLKFTGDLAGKVALDGPLDLHFENGITGGGGTVELGRGVFGLGKVRGALVQPNLFVVRAHATLKGAGKDAFTVIVGLATSGQTPVAASDLTVGFADRVSQTIPGASFVRKGTTDQFSGNLGGITKVVVDYSREQISITGKGLDLGSFAQGGNSVLLTVGLGNDLRAVQVRMGRIGSTMKY